MELNQNEFYNGFIPYDEDTLLNFDQRQLDLSFLELPNPNPNPSPDHGSSSVSLDTPSQEDSPDEFNDCVFNFINQILDEENAEGIQSLFCDPLELQATERSLYEALGQEYPGPNIENHSSTSSAYPGPLSSFDMAQNIFTDSESVKQFNRGMAEANKFLPPTRPLVMDFGEYSLPQDSNSGPPEVVAKLENDEPSNGLTGRKHYQLEENSYEEERSSKQSAVYVEEDELSEMFDQVLLCCKDPPVQINHSSTGGSNKNRNARKNASNTVDLSTLLVNCAQAVAAGDQRTATEQLNQIRQHASSWGDASQRLAHVFAIGIEARLAGTGSQLYAAKRALRISAAEKLQAYQVYLSACPFKKISMSFANRTIFDSGLTSSTIHVVDFGIAYGFQWPIFIKHLSELPNAPPKLRITGIEYPQSGFRPSERLEETGRRLANYCARFNVPFEYNAIAVQNWESIKIEDLKLQRNEFLAVNSLARFQNLLDETVCVESPRDKVLKLIHDMKPDIFIHTVVNGAYSAPFFVTRFRETLFHYSALFDMFDATIERGNAQRLNFEKEFFGREAMNVIACEGAERVERPESYKQWQVRISRAGFKLRPLNKELVSMLRGKRAGYHKDFVFDEDGKWILQGWKGRILYASSCWVPI